MSRIWIKDVVGQQNQTVHIKGWVDKVRDHGKLLFIDLRDRTGLVQAVVRREESAERHQLAKSLHSEDVLSITGQVVARSPESVNATLPTGEIEIIVEDLTRLATAENLPFEINTDKFDVNEETRLQYRYLDLRRPAMQQKMMQRSKMNQLFRDYLLEREFVEIETPMLTKSTPEGARDFIVPSRFHQGKFYALPQSPQQYKQLLMSAGFERYFQIARCVRDEDLRADRGFEFTQLDLEMSFVSQEDIMTLVEQAVIEVVGKIGGKRILQTPFPRVTEKEAVEKYGEDKFDLREDPKDPDELAFAWVVDFPTFVQDEATGRWTYSHNPFTGPKPELLETLRSIDPTRLNEPEQIAKIHALTSTQYDLVCNGYEVGGGGIRLHDPELLRRVFQVIGHSDERIDEEFGHMLKAFQLGTPPHGGIALGLDRMVMLLNRDSNLKETIAFPMTGSGRTAIMDAPSPVEESQLVELNLAIRGGQKRDVYNDIVTRLKGQHLKYRTFEHEEVRTSEEAAAARGTQLENGAKALVIKADDKFAMVVISAASKMDSKKLRAALGVKKTRFASAEEVIEKTGCQPGSVPPFGDMFGMTVYVDQSLDGRESIDFNAGELTKSIEMRYEDYRRVVTATTVDVGATA